MLRDQRCFFQTHAANREQLLSPNIPHRIRLCLGVESPESVVGKEFLGLLKLFHEGLVYPSESKEPFILVRRVVCLND